MEDTKIKVSLKALRINKELTQRDVAKILGVTARTVRNWEKGKTYPNLMQLKTLELIYEIPFASISIQL